MEVRINWPRAEAVCGQLITALRNGEFPYSETWALPQTMIPEEIRGNELLHARFLFYVCHYMRGTIKSDHAVRQLIALWRTHPEFFDPMYVNCMLSADRLGDALQGYIGYKTEEITRFWHENSRRLVKHWKGDPRMIFEGVTSARVMYGRIRSKSGTNRMQGFLGFQEKMASMLAYFLMDANLVLPFTASPPVDFHLVRVMVATGILDVRDNGDKILRYEHLFPKGIKALERYVQKEGSSLVELGNAFWMLSVVACSRAPGNGSAGRTKEKNGKEKVSPTRVPANWDNPNDIRDYHASCESCPVREVCTKNIPSGAYYEAGRIEVWPRDRPDEGRLLPLLGQSPVHRRILRRERPPRPFVIVARTEPLFDELHEQRRPKREIS